MLDDVTCDKCGESMRSPHGNINGVSVTGSGSYDSTHIPDGSSMRADVCERCASEWFATFKRDPVTMEDL